MEEMAGVVARWVPPVRICPVPGCPVCEQNRRGGTRGRCQQADFEWQRRQVRMRNLKWQPAAREGETLATYWGRTVQRVPLECADMVGERRQGRAGVDRRGGATRGAGLVLVITAQLTAAGLVGTASVTGQRMAEGAADGTEWGWWWVAALGLMVAAVWGAGVMVLRGRRNGGHHAASEREQRELEEAEEAARAMEVDEAALEHDMAVHVKELQQRERLEAEMEGQRRVGCDPPLGGRSNP